MSVLYLTTPMHSNTYEHKYAVAFFTSIQQSGRAHSLQHAALVGKGRVHYRRLLWHSVVWLIFAEVAE